MNEKSKLIHEREKNKDGFLRRLVSEWKKAVAAYRNRMTLLDYPELVQPGLWIFSGWEMWVRAGANIPEHLLRSKGNRRGPLLYRWVKMMLSPIYWVRVPKHDRPVGEYYAMVKGPRVKREPIFFSDSDVLRVLNRERDPDQKRLRALWDQYVSNSAVVEEKTTDTFFVEQLIPGGITATLVSPAGQVPAIRTVFAQYRELGAASPFGLLAGYRNEIEPKLTSSSHVDLIRLAIGAVGEDDLWALTMAPQGSDASPDNAIISDDGVAYFVDTEPLYIRPTLSHPVSIIAGWNNRNGPLVDMYLGGSFDDELRGLLPAGGKQVFLDEKKRMAWLALAILIPSVTPPVIRRKMRPQDGLLRLYGLEDKAKQILARS